MYIYKPIIKTTQSNNTTISSFHTHSKNIVIFLVINKGLWGGGGREEGREEEGGEGRKGRRKGKMRNKKEKKRKEKKRKERKKKKDR